jgi:tetratricopeptide (TPR) repeat protein
MMNLPLKPPFAPLALLLTALALGACSSAPKKPAETSAARTAAWAQLELANREAERGNYGAAREFLAEGRRLAVSADDPPLLVRAALAWGNILSFQGDAAGAAAAWDEALAEAERAGERELAALCRVYMARSRLQSGASPPGEVRAAVGKELPLLKDRLSAALAWTVAGLAEKEDRRWNEAEAAVKKALDIHLQDDYLENAAYDWFLIASIRSVAGNYPAAREALGEAVLLDRRTENSYGLASDWRALGDLHRKAGESAEAAAAWARSAGIFRSIGMEAEAAAVEARLTP